MQMRLSIQVPLRVCLVYGYATTYTRLQKPYPWITAILCWYADATISGSWPQAMHALSRKAYNLGPQEVGRQAQ
eukprot:1159736-Pelagomonas_calceolata.AAC.2